MLVVLDCGVLCLKSLEMGSDRDKKSSGTAETSYLQRCILSCAAGLVLLWWRTLRFQLDRSVCELIRQHPSASVMLLWHNRLFAAPEFYRRHLKQRRMAALISTSSDGAWLAGFLERVGIRPVRGSRYNRGAQALRECLSALNDGCDVAITPDGSRGPVYVMKPGSAALAIKTGAPVCLFSFQYATAWRARSWDRFFVPLPFSRVSVSVEQMEPFQGNGEEAFGQALQALQAGLNTLTRDSLLENPKEDALPTKNR